MVVPLALVAAAPPGEAEPAVVVHDESGAELARVVLPPSGRFALAYRHSYYDAPARELFSTEHGGLRLRALASPRAAVLDYYALAGRRTRSGTWLALVPSRARRYDQLPLIATELGRRTLLVGERRIPLYGHDARHLTIGVEGSS